MRLVTVWQARRAAYAVVVPCRAGIPSSCVSDRHRRALCDGNQIRNPYPTNNTLCQAPSVSEGLPQQCFGATLALTQPFERRDASGVRVCRDCAEHVAIAMARYSETGQGRRRTQKGAHEKNNSSWQLAQTPTQTSTSTLGDHFVSARALGYAMYLQVERAGASRKQRCRLRGALATEAIRGSIISQRRDSQSPCRRAPCLVLTGELRLGHGKAPGVSAFAPPGICRDAAADCLSASRLGRSGKRLRVD
ncbi:hypothetical protein QBC34DRAFT_104553 [Podospora aff. communis PSN243]|uniref:Uncharacterized protein n=1 Tax=Podospora aff. communis PSN243 TaxID=3040156 RepID=A0AAV9H4S9_9PEZI|nr:hypothetical protein QBC34DRAFT_104553 [Podospora aff. communis PSN243]